MGFLRNMLSPDYMKNYNRYFLTAIFATFVSLVFAQHRVTLVLDSMPFTTDAIYLAGSINGWNPADSAYKFYDNKLSFTTNNNDAIEFKITRGSWQSVECLANGIDVSNRILKAVSDTTFVINVAAWKDAFPALQKAHTASKQVAVLDTAFYIPQLKRSRTLRIYLPADYATNKTKRYPVLYMHDGQNCFEEFTSGFGEWHVDEALDHFYDSCKKSMIVVAVDHGDTNRLHEYNPYDFEKTGKGEGRAYTQFLVKTLKPFIDKKFRTKPDKKNTAIAGSSMGGVISMWAMLAYPKTFGNAGIFSPAFWTSTPMFDEVSKKKALLKGSAFFFYAGSKESESMVPYTMKMYLTLKAIPGTKTVMNIDEEGVHNEGAWTQWFPVYLAFVIK